MKPQLAHVAKTLDPYMADDSWAMEEKFNGDRLLIVYRGTDQVVGYSRQGKEVVVPRIKTSRHTLEFTPAKGQHEGVSVLDGEVMPDGQFHVFDLPMLCDQNTGALTYERRRAILAKTFPIWQQSGFKIVESVTDTNSKINKLKKISDNNLEGVVFKHIESPYVFDYRSSLWLKWKLYKTCSAIVTEMNREGKPEAVTICVYDNGSLHELSGCKIPSRYQQEWQIKQGDVVEIRYLSVSSDYKLIQPIFLKKRTDITPTECTKDQLNAS